MEQEKEKLLRLMRYWLLGTFSIVFAAITAFFWQFTGGYGWTSIWMAFRFGWPGWGVTGALCVLTYLGYKWYLLRRL
ncbi:MAG: hypothetical protein D6770_10000 [Anaerolineae bacterium]|nr:MAG: hypothetical protein D6770_10000 [Anaerolineae bacterium]